MGFQYNPITGFLDLTGSGSGGGLTGQTLAENNIIVGDATDESVAVDTSAVGDILVDETNGANIKAGVIVNADINAAAAIDATKLADGSVSNAEFQFINTLTSNAQTQLNAKASATDVADLVTLSGVAVNSTTLGTFTGTIISDGETVKGALQDLESFIESLPNPIYYAGTWDASTNTPTLDNTDTGVTGALYRVNVAGTVDFGAGPITFAIGDSVVNNGTIWEKWDFTDQVLSVNGQMGVVVLDTDDINEGATNFYYTEGRFDTSFAGKDTGDLAEGANLYFTDERAQDAVGTILTDTATIDLTYNDGANTITADLEDTAVTPGTFGTATQVGTFTVDQQGRLTAASNTAIAITSAAITDFNEAAQDAVGGILTDTASIDLVYNDGANTITANVLPAGVDHDQLLNFVANEHVDHSAVQIATAANTSGLAGGGDITATRNLVVDINGTTAETVADNADKILIYDNSATALRSMTRGNFLSGFSVASAGDLNEGSFAGLVNDTDDQVITGFAFSNAVVRSFKALASVTINADSDLYAVYDIHGIQRGADWQISTSVTGDVIPEFSFNITTAGQLRASIGDVTGFVDALIKYRAQTTTV